MERPLEVEQTQGALLYLAAISAFVLVALWLAITALKLDIKVYSRALQDWHQRWQ